MRMRLDRDTRLTEVQSRRTPDHPDTVLVYQGRRLNLDNGHLPLDLGRLVPTPYYRTTAADWKPFIHRAILHRLL